MNGIVSGNSAQLFVNKYYSVTW